MKDTIARYILRQKKRRQKRRVQAVNLNSARTALIVYNASIKENEKKVRNFARFLKEEGVKVDSIAFYKLKGKEDRKPEDELGYLYFDKKELNWLGFPKSSKLLKYIAKEYDLLIDLNIHGNYTLSIITILSSASFKVGVAGKEQSEACDLTLAVKENSLDYLIEQITTYLKMINKK